MSVIYGGTYTSGILLSNPATQNPATVAATGYVTNTASAGIALYGEAGFAWTVSNYGTITGSYDGAGISLRAGGSIGNAKSAAIECEPKTGFVTGAAIIIAGGPGTIANAGYVLGRSTIVGGVGTVANSGTISGGVTLEAGGTVTNAPGALFEGPRGFKGNIGAAVAVSGTAGSVTNLGTVFGSVALYAGGGVTNATAAGISGGVTLNGPASVANFGTIEGGVTASGAAAITNSGTLYGHIGGDFAVVVDGQATVTNSGIVDGVNVGIDMGTGAAATIVNQGTITGAVAIYSPAASPGDTVFNYGTIDGTFSGTTTTALQFGNGPNLLVVDPGAVFIGKVYGGYGANTLELASAAAIGTLTGLGTDFTNLTAVKIESGAEWQLSGTTPAVSNDGTVVVDGSLSFGRVTHDPGDKGVIEVGDEGAAAFTAAVAKGEMLVFTGNTGTALMDRPLRFKATISGFAGGDVIDLVGRQADGLSFASHQLVVTEGRRTVADLHFAGDYTTGEFSLSPDGNGGTEITLLAPSISSLWTMRG